MGGKLLLRDPPRGYRLGTGFAMLRVHSVLKAAALPKAVPVVAAEGTRRWLSLTRFQPPLQCQGAFLTDYMRETVFCGSRLPHCRSRLRLLRLSEMGAGSVGGGDSFIEADRVRRLRIPKMGTDFGF